MTFGTKICSVVVNGKEVFSSCDGISIPAYNPNYVSLSGNVSNLSAVRQVLSKVLGNA